MLVFFCQGRFAYSFHLSINFHLQLLVSGSYNPDTSYGDIAILKLVKPIDLPYVELASKSTNVTAKVDVVGWGITESQEDAETLMYSQLTTMSSKKCKVVHKNIFKDYPPLGTVCYGKL